MKRIYRNSTRGMIGGVSHGMGEYFGIDPVIIRIAWIVAFIAYGAGALLYILFWILLPDKNS